MKTAVVLSMMRYPNGDAGAVRAHSIAKILSDEGYDVTVLGYGEYNGQKMARYDGVRYTSMRLKGTGFFSKALSRLTYPSRAIKFIKRSFEKVDLIVVDYVRIKTFAKLEKYAAKTGTRLFHDSCEWFSAEEFSNGTKNSLYKYAEKLNTEVVKAPWEVISISSYLDEHFKGRGLRSVRLPVVMDVESMEYRLPEDNKKLIFVYAGSPGKKDFLSEMIKGFSNIVEDFKDKFEFHIIGATDRSAIDVGGASPEDIRKLGEHLVFHGRVNRDEAIGWVRCADFTVLLRNSDLRYTKAGFPTKVVESLSSATPVITNITSDLGMYLKDGENSVISEGYTAKELAAAIRRAINLTYDERFEMSKGARKCAEESFDYRKYSIT